MAKKSTTPAPEPETEVKAEEAAPPQAPGVTERIEALEAKVKAMASYLRSLSGQEF